MGPGDPFPPREEYRADELVGVTITHDPKARLYSYELLAGAFEPERREDIQP